MAPYAIATGVGLAAISLQIEALAARIWPGSQRVGTFATVALAAIVALLSMRSLSDAYAANPKQLPVDLRGGFDYVISRIQPNDLLLEASTIKGGSVYWFSTFDFYYLRNELLSRTPARAMIEDLNFPAAFTNYLDRQGSLWVLIAVADDEIGAAQDRAGPDFYVQCFQRICAIHWRGGERPMLEQLGAFFDRFSDLDPNYFAAPARAVRAALDQVRADR